MLPDMANEPIPLIDAKTFQKPIWALGETLGEKVRREGPGQLSGASYIADDIHMMIRQASATYNLLFYLNADERRDNDPYWNNSYGVVTAPVVRTMIDCLYNITMILEDPAQYGPLYRKSGLKKRLLDIEEDQKIYAGKPEWDYYNAQQLKALDGLIRGDGFTEEEIRRTKSWTTLGTYVDRGKEQDRTSHQLFLKTFTHMQWRQYSGLSHAGFDGYIGEIPAGAYFVTDRFPHEQRPQFEEMYKAFVTKHIGRAAMILLSLVTELQLYFRFDGANINDRIQKMWAALSGFFEADELYRERYCGLMKERGILPKE
jgi:hypothetical protein